MWRSQRAKVSCGKPKAAIRVKEVYTGSRSLVHTDWKHHFCLEGPECSEQNWVRAALGLSMISLPTDVIGASLSYSSLRHSGSWTLRLQASTSGLLPMQKSPWRRKSAGMPSKGWRPALTELVLLTAPLCCFWLNCLNIALKAII